MIHVNVRGLLIRKYKDKIQLVIQLRKRKDEPEVYELPGGRINEYEKITDALRREVKEETGLKVTAIRNESDSIITSDNETESSFAVECISPFCAYQTIKGPVDSFGLYFMCEVEGEMLKEGDDTTDIHWADMEEINEIIDKHKFSEIDLPAVLMFLRGNDLNTTLTESNL